MGNTKRLAEASLKSYYECCAGVSKLVAGDGLTAPSQQEMQRLVQNTPRAKVFVVDVQDFQSLRGAANTYTSELAKVDIILEDAVVGCRDEAESYHMADVLFEQSCLIPFPASLPFEDVFVAFGEGVPLSPFQMAGYLRPDLCIHSGIMSANILGFLFLGESQEIHIFIKAMLAVSGSEKSGMAVLQVFDPKTGWHHPLTLDPWIIPMLVQTINDSGNVSKEFPGLTTKLARKAVIKREATILPIPMPYYVMKLRDGNAYAEELVSQLPRPERTFAWSHRWDVRGHGCTRVKMGPLPLDPRIEKKLKKSGYRIYEGEVAPEDFDLLAKRGVLAKRQSGEWVAVLTWRRKAHVKGPEDKPYVPTVRVLPECAILRP